MNTICAPNGKVLRIVVFKKQGVQAMVEYPFTDIFSSNLKLRLIWEYGQLFIMFMFSINSFLTQNVRFETIGDAVAARQALNGADIYSGCCTLKIEYARVSHPVLFLGMFNLKYFYLLNNTFFMFLDVKIECDAE